MGVDAVTISASFTDVGTLDTHTALINWGDGHSTIGTIVNAERTGTVVGSLVYTMGGIFTITVTLGDDDSATDIETTSAAVSGTGMTPAGQLQFIGTAGRDMIHATTGGGSDGWIRVNARLNLPYAFGSDSGFDGGSNGGPDFRVRTSDVTSILILGGSGDDHLHVSNNVTVRKTIDGGQGNDQIWSGGADDSVIDLFGDNEIHAGKGDPSSGKCHTARTLIASGGVVLETDEYFDTQVGADPTHYEYSVALLPNARFWNFARFQEAVARGISPIVVDRGNGLNVQTQQYARHAADRGYQVQLREPDSPWWAEIRVLLEDKNANEAALRKWADRLAELSQATHRVPASTILHWMAALRLDITVEDILRL